VKRIPLHSHFTLYNFTDSPGLSNISRTVFLSSPPRMCQKESSKVALLLSTHKFFKKFADIKIINFRSKRKFLIVDILIGIMIQLVTQNHSMLLHVFCSIFILEISKCSTVIYSLNIDLILHVSIQISRTLIHLQQKQYPMKLKKKNLKTMLN